MSKNVKRGIKRTCGSCGDKFSDLKRDPIMCPICESDFRLGLPQETEPEKEESDQVESEELPEGTEVVSLEEVDESKDSDVPSEEIDDLEDISDESPDLATDDDDTFLEEEEDPESDVNSIIGTAIEPKDES